MQEHVNDGEYLEQVSFGNTDVLQVVDTDYDEDHILIATIDPSFNSRLTVGLDLQTKSGHQFTLNFNRKFPTLVIPPDATAIYARCGDVVPKLDDIAIVSVGIDYVDPIITIGTGSKKKQIGSATKDSKGRLIKATITEPVLGFVKPVVEDRAENGRGNGGLLSVVYTYSGPREIKENNILPLTQYIDCVGHPMIKSAIEEEEAGFTDTGFNLVDGSDTSTTDDTSSDTVTTTPTVTDPVSTPVNQPTQPSTPSTPSTPTPPSTPPAQNNPPQQGGYGGY